MTRFFMAITIMLSIVQVNFGQTIYEIVSSKMTIAGTSNVHNWVSDVTKITATADLSMEGTHLKSLNAFAVSIPVNSIISSSGSIMDKKTYSALKSSDYPTIGYKLIKVTNIEKKGNEYTIKTTGHLSIAGVTKTITMNVKGKRLNDDSWQFEGTQKLLMTDYGIDPPTALMGTMRTGNEITVAFTVKMMLSSTGQISSK